MRWEQLNEAKLGKKNLVKFIKTNCAEYLRHNPNFLNHPLYRGIETHDTILVKEIRRDRKPLNTNRFLHQLYDDAMEAAGINARRSNSIFCTPRKSTAEQYGICFVIFPIGHFDFTSSVTIKDLTNQMNELVRGGAFKFKNEDDDVLNKGDIPFRLGNEEIPETFSFKYMVKNILPIEGYRVSDWFSEIDESDLEYLFDRLDLDKQNLAQWFKKEFDTDSLTYAIENGSSEILISGDEYLAIDLEWFYWLKDNWK